MSIEEKIYIFKQITEYITLSSSQLGDIIELIDDEKWMVNAYLCGIAKIYDLKINHDFIKIRCKQPEVMKKIYNAFGILNLFSIQRLNGMYWLDLGLFEERIVAKILIELAKVEGFDKIINASLNGKAIPVFTKEIADKMNFNQGILEFMYLCSNE